MNQGYQQLAFHFEPREKYTFDAFVTGNNRLIVEMIEAMAGGTGEKQMLVWAEHKGCGKSHLLQAACHRASQSRRTACFLPADQVIDSPVWILEGLEQIDLVCIDDIQLLLHSEDWEEALFDLINRIRESSSQLLLASAVAPERMQVDLRDLHSRLTWGPVFQLIDMDDDDKLQAMQIRAGQYGLELNEQVAAYLLSHYPRTLFELYERIDDLDKASMAMQRKLTIPFVKMVLGQT